MSVADLKQRLHDVQGIHTLSMELEAGKIILRWGEGYSAAVDATASDNDIAIAVRNAAKLPPVSLIPEKGAPETSAVLPIVSPVSAAPIAAPAPAAQTMGQSMSATPAAPGAHALNIQDRLAEHSKKLDAILQTQFALLDATLSDQLNTVGVATEAVIAKVKGQTDDFKAIMGQFSNLLPGS